VSAVAVLEASGLHVNAGDHRLLRDVNLTVTAGERIAIVGHNGAGKSSFLRAVSGFNSVHRGSLKVLGTDISVIRERRALRDLRSHVAQVHQGLHLIGRLSVLDNVLIGGAARNASWLTWIRRWPTHEAEQARAALARVGMNWAAARRTDSLSGGERQKVAIARALHQNAPMLLADEPTASLDAEAADEVINLLTALIAERKSTLICVVHDLDLVPRLADRVIVLRRGQVVADVAVTTNTASELRGVMK
jgi:phosphonate transport system ATP-binding protein